LLLVARGLSMRSLVAALCLVLVAGACAGAARAGGKLVCLSRDHATGDRYMGIRLLGALDIGTLGAEKTRLSSLSALAWDEDEQTLHALSDSARAYRLRPAFVDGTLAGVTLMGSTRLRGADSRLLSKRNGDAEGLVLEHADNGVHNDTRYIVSFEIQPRIARHTPDGQFLETLPLPADLQDAHRYRSSNKALESVAIHPNYGHLTAPELPLRADPDQHIRIVSLHDQQQWWWPRGDVPNSSVVAIEVLKDGRLLVLERAFTSPVDPLVISIRRSNKPLQEQQQSQILSVQDISVMSSADGWYLDNFEGLTHHRGSRFFMVSDDNGRSLQRTLLVYFEILEDTSPSPDG